MSELAQDFTLLRIDNPFTAGIVQGYAMPGYSEIPELMNGEIQRQCQAAFRAHMTKDTPPQELMGILSNLITNSSENYSEFDILASNSAFALSAPCEDYPAIFEYINYVFEATDSTYFRYCQNTTSSIISANPLNPYMVFKQAPLTIWGRLDDAFGMYRNDVLLQLAVIFDDDDMVGKISSKRPNRPIVEKVSMALARVPYNPLSRVRAWLGTPMPSMLEIEHRLSLQVKEVENMGFSTMDFSMNKSPFSETRPYKTIPEHSSRTSFKAGQFNLSELEISSKDHYLRHLPGYKEFVKSFPGLLGDFLHKAVSSSVGHELIPIFIDDLRNAGVPGHEILYLHVNNDSPGRYLDKTSSPDFHESYMKDLLSYSGRSDEQGLKAHNLAMKTLLSLDDEASIDRYAKTDTELRSAYMVTQDRKYLNRLSERGVEEHLDQELGL